MLIRSATLPAVTIKVSFGLRPYDPHELEQSLDTVWVGIDFEILFYYNYILVHVR